MSINLTTLNEDEAQAVGMQMIQVPERNQSAESEPQEDQKRTREPVVDNTSIHWRSPLSMLGCLTSGILMTLFHHIFYNHLNGNQVGTLDSQELNTRFVTIALSALYQSRLTTNFEDAVPQLRW